MVTDWRANLTAADARHLTCEHPPDMQRRTEIAGFAAHRCRHCNSYQITRCDEAPEAVTGEWVWDETCRLLKRDAS